MPDSRAIIHAGRWANETPARVWLGWAQGVGAVSDSNHERGRQEETKKGRDDRIDRMQVNAEPLGDECPGRGMVGWVQGEFARMGAPN